MALLASRGMSEGPVIGVSPARAFDMRRRLFRALAEATGARFARWSEASVERVDAVVLFSPATPPEGVRSLVFAPGDGAAATTQVSLGRQDGLDRRLWSRRLRDADAAGVPTLPAGPSDGVLAQTAEDGAPLWVRTGLVDRAVVVPGELAENEVLRDVFRNGRFIAVLPLLHLARELEHEPRWRPPALRASIVFDDPNLRRASYGFVRYAELAHHAEQHRYHAVMATIPLDAGAVRREAARFFSSEHARLSLAVHGNDHLGRELARDVSDAEAQALTAHALRRIDELERRAEVRVARVMVPPHGALSERFAHALLRTGYEAVCTNHPYPWLKRPPADRLAAGWGVAEIVVGGLPLIPRFRLRDRDDLPLRAFLGQPLVLYGHSEDLAEGYEVLAEAARDVNAVGDVEWLSLGGIAETNYVARQQGETMTVRLFTRRARVQLQTSARFLVVELPPSTDGFEDVAIKAADAERLVVAGEPVDVAGQSVIDVALARQDALSPLLVPSPRRRGWPMLRRLMTEARDRSLPRVPPAARVYLTRTPAGASSTTTSSVQDARTTETARSAARRKGSRGERA